MDRDDLIDSLPIFYKSTFPAKLRQSKEGKQTEANLHAIMVGTHDQVAAPDFTATDIRGNTIRLDDYKGRYVLLNLWASWCGPCMAELPAIVRIREEYPRDSLALISVSSDSDSSAFLQAISKYKMDWIHIYRDFKLAELYGTRGLPMLFLIDKTGTIIYNRSAGKETDMENLSVLNEVLKKEFSH
jgi:thiol-disulfide isomerase/thioredoxin